MVVHPGQFTVEGVESVAADLKTLLAQVSTLSIKSTALREELEALRVAKPPRHPYFSDAAGDGNLIRAYVPNPPRCSSDQVVSEDGKVGPTTLTHVRFDPTSDGRVWSALVPDRVLTSSDVESAEPRLMDGLMGTSSMALVPEEDVAGMDGVVSPFDRLLHDLYGAEGEVVYKQATLKRLGLPSVFSTPLSTADNLCGFNLHEDDFVPLRVREYKGTNSSCVQALPQAFALRPVSQSVCCCEIFNRRVSLCP